MRLCLVLALTIFAATTWAAKWDAPSFCKCICFNSTNYKILLSRSTRQSSAALLVLYKGLVPTAKPPNVLRGILGRH
ncbi:hypothetical protein MKEN_00817400 [Mycena kentingensis (nom. inval.)]|nr:hypothetical protein MKEN_00817400 [Mycena kentingensis (nom. inval.)]